MWFQISVKEVFYCQMQNIEAETKEEAEEKAVDNIIHGRGIRIQGNIEIIK